MYNLTLFNITKFYSKLLLEFQISKGIGRDPRHEPYHIYGYLPNTHLVYNKEIRISTTHMVS